MTATPSTCVAAVAACVLAPLVGVAILRLTERRLDPRIVAIAAITTSLVAAMTAAAWWHLSDDTPILVGHRLAGAISCISTG